MNSCRDCTIETIEVPASVLWKRTLHLSVVSIGLGLGAGYLLGRSLPAMENPAKPPQPPMCQVRFLPADMYTGESAFFSGEETATILMPRARDLPEPVLPVKRSQLQSATSNRPR
jgi:hypothetical protein